MLPKSDKDCPLDVILKLIMGPWTAYIIWSLYVKEQLRYGELKKELGGISSKILTERLRLLESADIIYRNYEATVPPKVTYGLAKRGKELATLFTSLNELGKKWVAEEKLAKQRV